MPLYEYACDACGERFERIQKFSDPPVAECPTCGGAVRKLISSPAIQFKGSGWYITDYARSSGSKAKDGAGEGGSTPGSAEGGKGDGSGKSDAPSKADSAKPDGGAKSSDSAAGAAPAKVAATSDSKT